MNGKLIKYHLVLYDHWILLIVEIKQVNQDDFIDKVSKNLQVYTVIKGPITLIDMKKKTLSVLICLSNLNLT